MKTLLAGAMLMAGAPTLLGYVGMPMPRSPEQGAVHRQAAAAQPLRYTLSNAFGKTCQMRRGTAEGDTARLSAEAACDAVWPGLSRVVALSKAGRGMVTMQDASGKPVLSLAAGDGVAYEAIEPRSALVTVSVAN